MTTKEKQGFGLYFLLAFGLAWLCQVGGCMALLQKQKELREEGDVFLRDEDDYIEVVENGDFDIIFADGCMERMIPEFKGIFVDTRHFAVSGKLIGK